MAGAEAAGDDCPTQAYTPAGAAAAAWPSANQMAGAKAAGDAVTFYAKLAC